MPLLESPHFFLSVLQQGDFSRLGDQAFHVQAVHILEVQVLRFRFTDLQLKVISHDLLLLTDLCFQGSDFLFIIYRFILPDSFSSYCRLFHFCPPLGLSRGFPVSLEYTWEGKLLFMHTQGTAVSQWTSALLLLICLWGFAAMENIKDAFHPFFIEMECLEDERVDCMVLCFGHKIIMFRQKEKQEIQNDRKHRQMKNFFRQVNQQSQFIFILCASQLLHTSLHSTFTYIIYNMNSLSLRKQDLHRQMRRGQIDSAMNLARRNLPCLSHSEAKQYLLFNIAQTGVHLANRDDSSLAECLYSISNIVRTHRLCQALDNTFVDWLFDLLKQECHGDMVLCYASSIIVELSWLQLHLSELIVSRVSVGQLDSPRYQIVINLMLMLGNALIRSSNSRPIYLLAGKSNVFRVLTALREDTLAIPEFMDVFVWFGLLVIHQTHAYQFTKYHEDDYNECKHKVMRQLQLQICRGRDRLVETFKHIRMLVQCGCATDRDTVRRLEQTIISQEEAYHRTGGDPLALEDLLKTLGMVLFNEDFPLGNFEFFISRCFKFTFPTQVLRLFLLVVNNHFVNTGGKEVAAYLGDLRDLGELWRMFKEGQDDLGTREWLKLVQNIIVMQDGLGVLEGLVHQLNHEEQFMDMLRSIGYEIDLNHY